MEDARNFHDPSTDRGSKLVLLKTSVMRTVRPVRCPPPSTRSIQRPRTSVCVFRGLVQMALMEISAS